MKIIETIKYDATKQCNNILLSAYSFAKDAAKIVIIYYVLTFFAG